MIKSYDPHVYVRDCSGKLKHKFAHHSDWLPSLSISEQNEKIMTSSSDLKAVHIYSEEGNVESTIKLPEGHKVRGDAFHHVIFKIIVLAYVGKKDSYFLLCCTKAGKIETSTFLCNNSDIEWFPVISSHPNGPVVVVREKSITFI
jgi:WD40 repeat protein